MQDFAAPAHEFSSPPPFQDGPAVLGCLPVAADATFEQLLHALSTTSSSTAPALTLVAEEARAAGSARMAARALDRLLRGDQPLPASLRKFDLLRAAVALLLPEAEQALAGRGGVAEAGTSRQALEAFITCLFGEVARPFRLSLLACVSCAFSACVHVCSSDAMSTTTATAAAAPAQSVVEFTLGLFRLAKSVLEAEGPPPAPARMSVEYADPAATEVEEQESELDNPVEWLARVSFNLGSVLPSRS